MIVIETKNEVGRSNRHSTLSQILQNIIQCSVGRNVTRRAIHSESKAFLARHEVPNKTEGKSGKWYHVISFHVKLGN